MSWLRLGSAVLAGGLGLVWPGRSEGSDPALGPVVECREDGEGMAGIPTHPDIGTLLQFSEPIDDYMGRGFTEDPSTARGDFYLRWVRGDRYLVLAPLHENARATLHLRVGQRLITLLLFTAAYPDAWHKVNFLRDPSEQESRARVTRKRTAPPAQELEISPSRLLGVVDTLKLVSNLSTDQAASLVAANRALRLARLEGEESCAGWRLFPQLALRNDTLDTVALLVVVENATKVPRTLPADGWLVRVGDQVYSPFLVQGGGEIAPAGRGNLILALVGDGQGRRNHLSPDNIFRVSLLEENPAPSRPTS